MKNNSEVRAALERARRAGLNAPIGGREAALLSVLADEPTVVEFMERVHYELLYPHLWEDLSEAQRKNCIEHMRATLKALAKCCQEKTK